MNQTDWNCEGRLFKQRDTDITTGMYGVGLLLF